MNEAQNPVNFAWHAKTHCVWSHSKEERGKVEVCSTTDQLCTWMTESIATYLHKNVTITSNWTSKVWGNHSKPDLKCAELMGLSCRCVCRQVSEVFKLRTSHTLSDRSTEVVTRHHGILLVRFKGERFNIFILYSGRLGIKARSQLNVTTGETVRVRKVYYILSN